MDIGLDYASVDQNAPPDFNKAKAAGTHFVILRGAYGTWQDTVVQRDWDALGRSGLARGIYFFPTFDHTPEEEVAELSRHVHLDADELLAIDIENVKPENLPWLVSAVAAMRATFHRVPLIYTSERVWREDLHNPARPQEFADCPLWLAHYPWRQRIAPQSNPGTEPPEPYGWAPHDWWLHQYQGDAVGYPGFSSTVDISHFNYGSAATLIGARLEWIQKRLGVGADYTLSRLYWAICAFQRNKGVTADGIIGPRTLALLCGVGL